MQKKRLTDLEFMSLAAEMGEVRNVQAQRLAYAALVDGRTLADIAREYGVTSPWVMQCRDLWWDAYLRLKCFPPGWVKATVIAPEPELKQFLDDIEVLRQAYLAKGGE
ncbi:TrfB-related DNA-binding protein [Castellaniella sp.]|uniref:TrfB-related DNA-binding protein n=1 Tax=Castellaniella sp. TaxID=1955812 RepID=UPI002AFF5B2C|nr:TrfB-related DNA-binding protein [Castellaniella sp.]